MRILFIDDSPTLLQYAKSRLTQTGHQVDVSTTVSHACSLVDIHQYDVILIDVYMPPVYLSDLVQILEKAKKSILCFVSSSSAFSDYETVLDKDLVLANPVLMESGISRYRGFTKDNQALESLHLLLGDVGKILKEVEQLTSAVSPREIRKP